MSMSFSFDQLNTVLDQIHKVMEYKLKRQIKNVELGYPIITYHFDPEDGSRQWYMYLKLKEFPRNYNVQMSDLQTEMAVLLSLLYPNMPNFLVYITPEEIY